jgi:pimeloyl-ACP methyl ester carboxylesterase
MDVTWTSHTMEIDGPFHYVDFGAGPDAPPDAPAIVLVHGLGGSYLNWALLGPRLTVHARVYAVDLPGFGLSHPAGRRGTVTANAGVLGTFLDRVVGGPAVLVGNSMGGMISMIYAAARPDDVVGLVLLDPALPRAPKAPADREVMTNFAKYAIPGLGERFMAKRRREVPPTEMVRQTLNLCSPNPDRVPAGLNEASADLIRERAGAPGIDHAYMQAARSLMRFGARGRRYRAMMRALPMPVLLLHGEQDRLVPVESARAAAANAPHWTFETFDGVGHIPMMEIPDVVADRITGWLPRTRDAGQASRTGRS